MLVTVLYIFQNSTVGILIYLVLSTLILYWFNDHRAISFNYLSTVLIFDSIINVFFSSVWWRFYELLIMPHYSNINLTNFYTFVLQTLLTVISVYLLIKPLKYLLDHYSQTTLIRYPIYGWVINLFMASFWFFRLCTSLRLISVTTPQYLTIMVLYAIVIPLAMYLPTRSLEKDALIHNQQIELDNLAHYTSHIEAMYDELRRFRHDYKNILLSLNDAVENKNMDQISAIFNRVIIPTNQNVEIRTAVLGQLANLQDLEIKSLVYSKTIMAIDKGINVNIEIENLITLTSEIKITDMLRIIAILFDNAINAAQQAKDPQISFSFFSDQQQQVLTIGNSTADQKLNLNKLAGKFNGRLTPSHHGLGLRNLRTILARYPFIKNNRSSKNYWFEQEIIIYNKAK